MTKEEAIFCEKSYIGETNCTDCKYYGTDTCQSRVSHKMAIKSIDKLERIKQIVNAPIMNNQADYLRVESIRKVLEQE